MCSLQEICVLADEWMQPKDYVDYCENGLQFEGKKKVLSIASAVTASLETIEEAARRNVDLLLVHHGLFWKGDSFSIVGTQKLKFQFLVDSELSILAYHLPLDCHREYGNNWRAARELGFGSVETFFPETGLGILGDVGPLAVGEMKKKLETYYGGPAHHAPGGRESIERVALVSGGAHKFIKEAASQGCDCFITGSFDEPVWHSAKEEGIEFFALGHSNTEKVGPRALGEALAKKLDISHQFIDFPNPF